MRKVILRMNEMNKYQIIKKLVETNGNKKRAAIVLDLNIRTIYRLIKIYKECGKDGFVHKNRLRKPACTFDLATKNMITNLYCSDYSDTNITHYIEILKLDFNIVISDNTVINWLKEVYTLSFKANKYSKSKMRKHLSNLHSASSNKVQNKIIEAIETIDFKDAHPRRSRSKYAGEMIQMDASSFKWVGECVWHLHVAIDDASGNIVGAYFDTQETLNGYYNVFSQILSNHGIPAMFYTDRRTVFEYKKKDTSMSDEDTFTQFSYACHQLGVEIKTTSVAQAKGRVERLNQTLLSRLPVELRRANITSIEQANAFLNNYVKEFNKMFALHLNDTLNVYELQPSSENINYIQAVLDNRVIDNGHSIKYNHDYFIPINKDNVRQYFSGSTNCMVIKSFDGNLFVRINDQIYGLEKIEKFKDVSKDFDEEVVIEKKQPHIFLLCHILGKRDHLRAI